jgi:hypothetical protein
VTPIPERPARWTLSRAGITNVYQWQPTLTGMTELVAVWRSPMARLLPTETDLTGQWRHDDGKKVADDTCTRIQELITTHRNPRPASAGDRKCQMWDID